MSIEVQTKNLRRLMTLKPRTVFNYKHRLYIWGSETCISRGLRCRKCWDCITCATEEISVYEMVEVIDTQIEDLKKSFHRLNHDNEIDQCDGCRAIIFFLEEIIDFLDERIENVPLESDVEKTK